MPTPQRIKTPKSLVKNHDSTNLIKKMNVYTVFMFAILAVAAVSGHRCRGSSYGGGGRGGGIVIGATKD
ncbi:Protein CBG26039 [Caenorhabditis briggsae]|uniref:Transmembrane protein n=2 Tax=Caenorhabditis briggsae TaxID=6238 RepID=A0AAE9DFV5_CAEBR|nr:Protein CBG26039 [Caenorhabditis briggsae]ULU02780.1 hypothetical protein L3Y34_002399 [Caenorhabditis briggsae]UMM25399.1 hypothetical protein L5515_005240 [Caenorhabditis briggsae]CAR99310.1 Protein CBG26039 [Caenorhabditis briggsae]